MKKYCAVVLLAALLVSPALADCFVSGPVGFVRIPVAAQGQVLVSIPFNPFDSSMARGAPSINAVLAGQMTGSTNEETSDRVLKWSAENARYVMAFKADGTGNPEIDGKWFADFSALISSDMTLTPGEGFWLVNRQNTNQAVFLAGKVILDATNSVVLVPSLNLIGYPYSSSIDTSNTALSVSGTTNKGQLTTDAIIDPSLSNAAPSTLQMGKGYWYARQAEDCLVWTEVRPYANAFPTNDAPPMISGLAVVENGTGVKLSIACAGETIDIFYQDLSVSNSFDTATGWKLAEISIPVGDSAALEWTDKGGNGRRPVNEVFARYYLVARADVDLDGNGIPDAREEFVLRSDIESAASSPAGVESSSADQEPTDLSVSLSTNTPGTNICVTPSEPPNWILGRIIYVDQKTGDDTRSGRAPIVVDANQGPKKTIRAGLAEAESGDTLIIKEGDYSENLNIAGKDVSVRIEGHVNLSKKRHER